MLCYYGVLDTDEMSISSIQEPSTIEDDKISLDNSKLTGVWFYSIIYISTV